MKIIFTYILMMICAFSASAKDACSPQIIGYVAGLNAGATFAGINEVQRDKVIKQIEYIRTLQKTLTDCEIINYIPELKASKEALEFAVKKAKSD
jgi:hypothetical protein